MISAGKNIQNSCDELKKIKVEYLYYSIRNPKPVIESAVRQLRIVRSLDRNHYTTLKRKLPYIVCAQFNPSYRKVANFAFTEYFIIDIDELSNKGICISEIRTLIQSDSRVVLSFVSPSEDGLKVMFRLNERCYDAGIYSIFYKAFLKSFSLQYHLEQVIDSCTSDVSRACFISIDADAYYNPNAERVTINDFINPDDSMHLFTLKKEFEKEIKVNDHKSKQEFATEHQPDPESDVMMQIKQTLNPKLKLKNEKPVPYVPQKLEEIITDLVCYIQDKKVVVNKVTKIQYGIKIEMQLGCKKAEINMFYGKRGFTIVQSPRCGTSPDLNELMSDVIENFLDTYQA